MFKDLFSAIGIVFSLLVFTAITLASLYIAYILGIGILILGAIFLVFYFLQRLKV